MTDFSDDQIPGDRPRPTARPRPGAAARPSPRPRVAGSRRDRDDADAIARTARPAVPPRPAPSLQKTARSAAAEQSATAAPSAAPRRERRATAPAATRDSGRARRTGRGVSVDAGPHRSSALVAVLTLLCVATAAVTGWLLWDRLHPRHVDASVFSAARSGVQALYAFDYHDPDGSIRRKLDVLTGDLHDRYRTDLSKGGIIDTYKQVSATTSYEVRDVGLQQINDAQDTATLVVFGRTVVKSVNSGTKPAPADSECQVTPEGAQACTQTLQIGLTKVSGKWKIDDFTVLTTS